MSSPLLQSTYNILAAAWRQRYTIILPIFILPILGALVSLMSPPKYTSHTSFLVQETGKDNPYLSDLSVETNLKERISGLETLLHSRHILTSVVEELHEDDEQPFDEAQLEYEINILSSAISVKLIGKNLIQIVMFSDKPTDMKKTVSAVSKHFISSLLEPSQSSISSSEKFLRQQLDELEVTLQAAEERMAKYKHDHADELPESHQNNLQRLRMSQTTLEEKEVELAGARLVIENLQSKVLELDPVLAELETNLVELRSDLALKRARYTDKHSSVRGLLRKIDRLEQERQRLINKKSIDSEDIERFWSIRQTNEAEGGSDLLMSQISGLQQEQQKVKRLTEEVSKLQQNIDVLKKRVQAYGKNEKVLREMEREINVKSKVYEDLLERYEKAQVSRSLGEFEAKDRIKVIDKPFDPIRPLNLPLVVFVIFGVVGGLFAGISFAVVNELMNNKLYSLEQIEQITGVRVIARLPNFKQGPMEPQPVAD